MTNMLSRGWLGIKLIVTVGMLFFVGRAIDWTELSHVFVNIDVFKALLALLVFLLAQVVSSLRCAYIARGLGGELSLPTSVYAHLIGLWFNQVLPTGLGGDVFKVAILQKKIGLPIAIRAAILDRLSGLVFLLVAVFICLPMYYAIFARQQQFVALLCILPIVSIGIMVALGLWSKTIMSWKFVGKYFSWPVALCVDALSFCKGRKLLQQFWTSSVVHFNGIASYAILGMALGVHVDILHFVLIVPLVFLVALLPMSIAGWGAREVGAVWLFGFVGVGREPALAMALSFGFMLILAGLPGLFLVLRSRNFATTQNS